MRSGSTNYRADRGTQSGNIPINRVMYRLRVLIDSIIIVNLLYYLMNFLGAPTKPK